MDTNNTNNNVKNNLRCALNSKTFKIIVYTLGVLAVAFLIFEIGMVAGFRKASFGRDWGENYENNFGSPHRMQFGREFGDMGNLPNAHGAIGKIIKVELPNLVVLDGKDNTEKVIILSDDTEIHMMKDLIKKEELKENMDVMIIGSPNSSGQIEAKLIRILPPRPDVSIENN